MSAMEPRRAIKRREFDQHASAAKARRTSIVQRASQRRIPDVLQELDELLNHLQDYVNPLWSIYPPYLQELQQVIDADFQSLEKPYHTAASNERYVSQIDERWNRYQHLLESLLKNRRDEWGFQYSIDEKEPHPPDQIITRKRRMMTEPESSTMIGPQPYMEEEPTMEDLSNMFGTLLNNTSNHGNENQNQNQSRRTIPTNYSIRAHSYFEETQTLLSKLLATEDSLRQNPFNLSLWSHFDQLYKKVFPSSLARYRRNEGRSLPSERLLQDLQRSLYEFRAHYHPRVE